MIRICLHLKSNTTQTEEEETMCFMHFLAKRSNKSPLGFQSNLVKLSGCSQFVINLHLINCLSDPSLGQFRGSTACTPVDRKAQLHTVLQTVLKGTIACIWRCTSTLCTFMSIDACQCFCHESNIRQRKCLTLVAINVYAICIWPKLWWNSSSL